MFSQFIQIFTNKPVHFYNKKQKKNVFETFSIKNFYLPSMSIIYLYSLECIAIINFYPFYVYEIYIHKLFCSKKNSKRYTLQYKMQQLKIN